MPLIDGESVGIRPMLAVFAFTSGSDMILFISACSRFTISFGVLAGASSTCQDTDSKSEAPETCENGGTSGRSGSGVVEDTASARNLPSLIAGIEAPASTKPVATWPAIMSDTD